MLSTVVAASALFVALGGPAAAATGLVNARNIATGAVTGKAIKNGTIGSKDLNKRAKSAMRGRAGSNGTDGRNGLSGINGANGPNGANGADGTNGKNGSNGAPGADGADGTLGPLSTTAGLVPLPTATPPTVVVSMAVPAGNYVVFAKTQLTHSGAGDSVDCTLKAGAVTIDQVSMKTLPALASIPASMEAVTTNSPTELSVECDVLTANGSASFNHLIAIPVN